MLISQHNIIEEDLAMMIAALIDQMTALPGNKYIRRNIVGDLRVSMLYEEGNIRINCWPGNYQYPADMPSRGFRVTINISDPKGLFKAAAMVSRLLNEKGD